MTNGGASQVTVTAKVETSLFPLLPVTVTEPVSVVSVLQVNVSVMSVVPFAGTVPEVDEIAIQSAFVVIVYAFPSSSSFVIVIVAVPASPPSNTV